MCQALGNFTLVIHHVMQSTFLIATELACPAYDIKGPQEWIVGLNVIVKLLRGIYQ